jgi:hypothetical protein
MKSKRLFFLVAVGIFSLLHVPRCHAETAEEMLSACRPITQAKVSEGSVAFQKTFETGICWGAFASLESAINFSGWNDHPLLDVCAPKDFTRTQLITIFVTYIEKHPEQYNWEFFQVATNSLLDVWTCKAPKAK